MPPLEEEPPKLPTVREEVEQRKLRLKEKEKNLAEERRTRFQRMEEENEEPPSSEEPPTDEPPVDEPPVVEEPPTDEPPVDEPPVDEPPVEEEDDFDDFEDDDEEPPVPEEDDEPPIVEDEPADIAAWRNRVQEQGRRRKEAEARIVELEGEVESRDDRIRELETTQREVASASINWNKHADITPMWASFDKIIEDGARTLSDAESAKQFRHDGQQALLQEYYKLTAGAETADDRLAAEIAFKSTLAERYGVEDGTALVTSVRNAVDKYIEIEDTIEEMRKKHDEGRLSLGAKQYEDQIAPFAEVFDDLGIVDPDFVEANPSAPESVVSQRYSDDDDYRVKADKLKARIQQFVFGLRPLSQEELDKAARRAEVKNMSVEEYLKMRESNYHKQRTQFFHDVFYHGMAMEDYGEMRKVYERYLASKKKRDAARRSISKAKPADKDKAPDKNKPAVRPKDRPYIPPSKRKYGGT